MSGIGDREAGTHTPPAMPAPAQPVSFTIDRLSFEGLSMTGGEAARAGAALARELTRLAAAGDWPATGSTVPSMRTEAVTIVSGAPPEQIGRAVARALIDAARNAR